MRFSAYDMVAPAEPSARLTCVLALLRYDLMGIYDRDYERSAYNDQPGLHLGGPKSMTVKLIIITVAVYVVQLVFRQPDGSNVVDTMFAMHESWFTRPWQLLTYGFLHSTRDMWHLLMNMFVLWMFGQRVEERYGSKEFLAFYLTAIVFAGLCWSISELLVPGGSRMLGASGGVSAVLLLFIFCFPHVTLLFMFLFPMPAWVLGILIVASDAFGAITRYGNVAFTAHLAGFLFALMYYKFGWRLMNLVPTSFKAPSFKRKPPLRVHRPSVDQEDKNEKRLNQLLDKVHQGGQDSLTASERRELQKLSKHYQNKRR
jgi:membrane associated rhomboid family serine protease